MTRKALTSLAILTILLAWAGAAVALTPEESFKNDFPNVVYQSIQPSCINGIYELEMKDGRIIYYVPATGNVILGHIMAKDGKDLTHERQAEIMSRKVKDIPLEQGLKIGNGRHTVIEFTDPDCPYCREASKFLSTQTDVTRYIFFMPLESHPDAAPKVRYIFCAKDKAKAYEEAMTGKLDEMKFAVCADEKIDKMMNNQKEIAMKIGINSTPTFFINGTLVRGADVEAMSKLLKTTPPASK